MAQFEHNIHEKQNGQKFENIQADVQSNMIFINDAQLPIEEGDKLLRTLLIQHFDKLNGALQTVD